MSGLSLGMFLISSGIEKFVLGNQGADEEMIGRQFDSGESGRLRDQGNVAAPVIENRFVSWNAEVFGGMVHRIQEAVLDPEVDKRQDAPVSNRLDGRRPHVVRHAYAVLKEIGSQVDCTTQTSGILSTRQVTGIDGYDPVTTATGATRLTTATSFSTR